MAWDEIVGQDFPKRLLQAHVASGQVASAYLLVGPEGVGKRRLAIEFAKALNCATCLPAGQAGLPAGGASASPRPSSEGRGSRPCDACPPCRQIARAVHPDVHVIVPGGVSEQIKIEHIRHLIGRVSLRPYSAAVQVAVIDGAERLTEEAANSLLKVLEEPPAHARFLLTTPAARACLPTILSRCQVVRCGPLRAELVARILLDGAHCEPRLAGTIARLAGGSAARAIALAGRWAAYEAATSRLAAGTPAAWFEPPLPEARDEVAQLLDGMLGWVRDLALATVGADSRVAHVGHAGVLRRQARAVEPDRCVETALRLFALRESLEQFVSPRLIASLAREHWLSLTTV
jgi:DNA polymerase-3 subunit delta'